MTFSQAFSNALNIYNTIFDGRATRSEYWWIMAPLAGFYVVMMVLMVAMMPAMEAMGPTDGPAALGGLGILAFVLYIAFLIYAMVMTLPMIILGGRRLHDTNRSVWWVLISFIPLVGAIVLLVFFVQRGTDGPNRFGPDPLGGSGPDAGSGYGESSIPSVRR